MGEVSQPKEIYTDVISTLPWEYFRTCNEHKAWESGNVIGTQSMPFGHNIENALNVY